MEPDEELYGLGFTYENPPALVIGHEYPSDMTPEQWRADWDAWQPPGYPADLSFRELVDLNPRDTGACVDFALEYGMPVPEMYCSADRAAEVLAKLRRCALHLLACYRDDYVAPVWLHQSGNYATNELATSNATAQSSNENDFQLTIGAIYGYEHPNLCPPQGTKEMAEESAWLLFSWAVNDYCKEAFQAVSYSEEQHTVSLGGAIALELRNIVADEPDPRTCTKCGRMFFVQRGTAVKGQHHRRGEVRYCSDKCRKAFLAKQRRDRKKMEKDREV